MSRLSTLDRSELRSKVRFGGVDSNRDVLGIQAEVRKSNEFRIDISKFKVIGVVCVGRRW